MPPTRPPRRAAAAFLLISLLAFLCPPPAPARAVVAANYFAVPVPLVILPDCTQANPCTLQGAVDKAAAGDTIYAAGGNYTATTSQVLHLSKSVQIQGGWSGTFGRVIVVNPALYRTALNGEGARGVVTIQNDASPTLRGLTIQNGTRAAASGGGILINNTTGGNVTIEDCIIRDNYAGHYGGGFYLQGGTLTVRDSQIFNNATVYGGGAFLLSQGSSALLENNLIYSNSPAGYGSLVHSDRAALVARGNRIRDHAGGSSLISANGDGAPGPFITLENNIISQNSGAILEQSGGELLNVSITHNTIVGASAGISMYGASAGSITNNIFMNLQGNSIYLTDSSSVTVNHNLFWQNGFDPRPGTQYLEDDPLLSADYHLMTGSPAIDAAAASPITLDIDGDPRPVGAGADIGADEWYQPIFLPFISR